MYHVVVITPKGVYLEIDCKELYVPTPNGVILLNQNHTDLVSSISIGTMRINLNKTRYFAIMGGVISTTRDQATIITSDILESNEINIDRAKESLKRNQDRLASKDSSIDIKRAKASLDRALVRIEVALKNSFEE